MTALISTAVFGIFFFLTLFLQQVWDYSPLRTALVYLPLTCLLIVGAKAGSPLLALFGTRTVVVGGLLVAGCGILWLARIGDSAGYTTGMLVPTVLTYAGLGVTGVPLTLAALSKVADEDAGAASGLVNMARQIGGATGLAVLGAVAWASGAGASGEAGAGLSDGVARGFAVAGGLTLLALCVAAVTLPRKGR